jgi:hypothetical protein
MSLHYLGFSPQDFCEDWPAKPFKSTAKAELIDTLTLSDVDELIAHRGLRSPAFRMAKDGKLLNPQLYTLAGQQGTGSQVAQLADPEAVAREISRGSTLILQGLQHFHPPAGQLARKLADDLGTRVFINAYLTPDSSKGFGEHSDPYGAFLVQLAGAKQWQLRPAPDASRETVTLHPLDVLWIPRGWLHDGVAMPGCASVHLTLAINPVSLAEVLGELTEEVSEQIRRTVFPPWPDHTPGALEDAIQKMSSVLQTALNGVDYQELARKLLMRASGGDGPSPSSVSAALGASPDEAVGNR